jgi:hypothetical protein
MKNFTAIYEHGNGLSTSIFVEVVFSNQPFTRENLATKHENLSPLPPSTALWK